MFQGRCVRINCITSRALARVGTKAVAKLVTLQLPPRHAQRLMRDSAMCFHSYHLSLNDFRECLGLKVGHTEGVIFEIFIDSYSYPVFTIQ